MLQIKLGGLAYVALLAALAWPAAKLEAARSVVLLGIAGDRTVTAEAINTVARGVQRGLSKNARLTPVTTEARAAGIQKGGTLCVRPGSVPALAGCGRSIGADLVVHGALRYRDGLELLLWLTDVGREQQISSVSWDLAEVSDLGDLSLEALDRLSSEAVRKLFWDGPELFPLRITDDALEVLGPGIRGEVRTHLSLLVLPSGMDVESAQLTLKKSRRVSRTGLAGMLLVVGWLFLPFWDVETQVEAQIKVRYLDEQGIRRRTLSAQHQFKRPRHLWMETRGISASSPKRTARRALKLLSEAAQKADDRKPDRKLLLQQMLYGAPQ